MKMNEFKPILTLIVVIFFGVVAYTNSNNDSSADPAPPAITTASSTKQNVNADQNNTIDIKKLTGDTDKNDLKSFTGNDSGVLNTKNSAISVVPLSLQEVAVGTSDPYGEKFDKFIYKKFPDIAKVKFHPIKVMTEDKDSLYLYKTAYYRGLYFSKLIKLADGETLFDLLTKCSKKMNPTDGAEFVRGQDFTFSLQFFPIFKQKGTGADFEEQILLVRKEDKIISNSPLFSTAILKNADFMDKFGITCAK
jgi:hypothetical protein